LIFGCLGQGSKLNVLVVHSINEDWVQKHVTIGLFETPNKTKSALIKLVKPLLVQQFQLTHKAINYIKHQGANLKTLATRLSLVVTCAHL
jgi:hypothetical protein